MKAAQGKVLKYGDNVDTDVIIPARYLAIQDKEELAMHAMEDIDADFRSKLNTGDLVVGGKNFGCGSSREHAPQVLQTSGVACVIAESFARIFFRNALNIGLPILECPEAAVEIRDGDTVKVDFDSGLITDETTGKTYQGQPFPEFLQNMIQAGGLMNYVNSGKL